MSDMKKILVLLTLPVLFTYGEPQQNLAGPNPYQSLLVLPTATNYSA